MERIGYVVSALLMTSGLIHLAILLIGGGSWDGPLSLRKAMSFGLSFGLTLLTIVWVSSFLRLGERLRTALLAAFTIACIVETALVSMQAWRGVPSHFNVETPFDAGIVAMLAGGGFALVAMILTLTFVSFRRNPAVPDSLRLAIRSGFVTLSSSLITGAVMIAHGMTLVRAGHADAAYATGGSLKPTHAVTMHAILILPLLAWLLSFVDWPEQRRLNVVRLASAGYLTFASMIAAENVAGFALWQFPLLPLAIGALGLIGLAVAGVMTVSGMARAFTADGGIEHS